MFRQDEFEKFDLDEKGELVFNYGNYLSTRSYYNFNVNLYSLFDFLVEVWYFCPENQIERIEVLKSNKTLNLYVKNVKIDNF